MDLASLQEQSLSGGSGNPQNSLCPTPPAQNPHQDVMGALQGALQGALSPARSRTTPPRRCWSCRRDRDLPELQVPRAGRALGRELLGELGGAGRAGSLTGAFHPCSHPWGHSVTAPIPAPLPGVPETPFPPHPCGLRIPFSPSLLPHFPPVPWPWLVAAGCHWVPWAGGGMLPFQ